MSLRGGVCLVLAAVLFGVSDTADGAFCASGAGQAVAAEMVWNPKSRPGYWCGSGIVPAGHAIREIHSANGELVLNLTVRQADDRLCYVADGIAEAPLLRLHPGDKLTIMLQNEINDPALIDTFVAGRYLDAPGIGVASKPGFVKVEPGMRHEATGATNLHMHGFPVPPIAPQDETLKTCADPATGSQRCGTHRIVYQYHLPASMPAGLYWYHPHIHGEVQPQILMGLSGPIVVEGPDDAMRRAAGIEDRVLIVRQTADTQEGRDIIPPPGMVAEKMSMPQAADTDDATATKIDTESEVGCGQALPDSISLNGTAVVGGRPPEQDIALFESAPGKTQFWRLVNGATDFFLNLAVLDEKGRPQPIQVVSWDGVPQADDLGHPDQLKATIQPQLVAPGARMEFLLAAPQAGKTFYLVSRKLDTGCAGDANPERWLARIAGRPGPGNSATTRRPMRDMRHSEIGIFAGLLAAKTQVRRRLALTEYPRPGYADRKDFYLTEMKPGAVIRPYDMNGPPAFTVKAGIAEEWEVENWTRELHAFHAHQVHFRVLSVNGKAENRPPLRDIVNVPFATPVDPTKPDGPLKPGIVRIKIIFPKEFAGDIPIHCHLVDHEDNGMMAVVHVAS